MRNILTQAHLVVALLLIAGCGGSDTDTAVKDAEHHLPRVSPPDTEQEEFPDVEDMPELSTQFGALPDYGLADFWLGENVLYWEVRTGPHESAEDRSAETAWRFDDAHYQALPEELRARVDTTESESGFQDSCQPAHCVVFGAAVVGEEVQMLATDAELLAFFGEINAEAKLNMWLWANGYHGMTYDVVDGGYEAIAKTVDIMCLEDRYYHLFVDTAGVITELEMVSTAKPQMCP